MVLSGGFGVRYFDEPIHLAMLPLLESTAVGWVQYAYNEWNTDGVAVAPRIESSAQILEDVLDRVSRHGPPRLVSFGISYGANIAAEVSLRRHVDLLVLVNPILDYPAYRGRQLGEERLKAWESSGSIVLDYHRGRLVSTFEFMREARRQHLLARLRSAPTPMVLFQGDRDALLSPEGLRSQVAGFDDVELRVVPGADHRFADPAALGSFVDALRSVIKDRMG